MPVAFCPSCAEPHRLKDDLMGCSMRCDACKKVFVAWARPRRKRNHGPTVAIVLAVVAGLLLVIGAGVGGYFLLAKRSKKDSAGAGRKGGANQPPVEPVDVGPKYDTPQAVFAAAKAASARRDFKEYARLLTRDGRELFVGLQTVLFVQFDESVVPLDKTGKIENRFRPALVVLERHGLTQAARTRIAERAKGVGITGPQAARRFRDAVAGIRDKGAFLGELAAALEGTECAFSIAVTGDLDDLINVQIVGDKATGTATWKTFKKVPNVPYSFTRENGGWKIDIPEGRGGSGR